MKPYIKLLRPKHYIKNILIFLPLIFSGLLFSKEAFVQNLIGFVCFSFAASMVYIINDIQDVENDRKHPIKKNRPIASGKVSISNAIILLVFLIIMVSLCYWLTPINKTSGLLIFLYLGLNIAYSFGLKNIPILDILILVSGFVIRVIYGSLITGVQTSDWLYLTIIAVSFYLGLGKRRNEMNKNKDHSRKVLKYYTKEFLDKMMYVFLGLIITYYSLWSMNVEVPYMIYTTILVITIILKYSLDIEGDGFGDPVDVITSDYLLLGLGALYGGVMFLLLYMI